VTRRAICGRPWAQGPSGQMGGFTRVLHDKADKLVDEIPTCVVDRLDNEMGFVVGPGG